jgi:CHAD domain
LSPEDVVGAEFRSEGAAGGRPGAAARSGAWPGAARGWPRCHTIPLVRRKSQAAPGDGVPLPGDASRTDLPDRVDGADGAPEAAPAAPAAPAPRSPKLVADLPLAVAGARVMLEQLERIEAHQAGARSGDDPEDVHRMRVATRRLRAARRVFGPALADASPALDGSTLERANAELKALADALGRVRDLDVFAAALREHVEAARRPRRATGRRSTR